MGIAAPSLARKDRKEQVIAIPQQRARKDGHQMCHPRMSLAGIHLSPPWVLDPGSQAGMTEI